MKDTEPPPALDRAAADAIVAEATEAYFGRCRDRIDGFVDRNFSFTGSARLHWHALGWDLLRAPANVALALPHVGVKLGAATARRFGRRKTAVALARRNLLLQTAVGRELRWRVMTELLRQPFRDGKRLSRRDGLAEAILAHPRMQSMLLEAGAVAAARKDDAAFRARLDAALVEYAGTRSAAAEIATALVALGTGAMAFHAATPGALTLGPVIAGALAQSAAVAGFPLGATAGGIWYGIFPAQASALLVAGATAGTLGAAAVATAFVGMVSDPVQRAAGLHRRRLHALVDGLERAFHHEDAAGFVAHDLYVARLIDFGDVLLGIARSFRPT
jgi:hypothetical protein